MHSFSPSFKAPTYLCSDPLPFPLSFFSSSHSTFYLFLSMVTVYPCSTQTPNLVSSSQLIYTIAGSILSFFSTFPSLFRSTPSSLLNNRKDFPPFGKCFSYPSPFLPFLSQVCFLMVFLSFPSLIKSADFDHVQMSLSMPSRHPLLFMLFHTFHSPLPLLGVELLFLSLSSFQRFPPCIKRLLPSTSTFVSAVTVIHAITQLR